MRLYTCPACGETLHFHNLSCVCGAEVAYDPDADGFVTQFTPCSNRAQIACNWTAEDDLCRSCAMTAVIPDTFREDNVHLWSDAEAAKRWVLANLGRWGWFGTEDAGPRPVFHLLSEETRRGKERVTMGHATGTVTINVMEADPAEGVKRREELGESYRTMIGHYRHELAHFLFERLVQDDAFATAFRDLFGDERADYGAALERHYGEGAPQGWQDSFVTPYASAHPHEDWAESVANLLHLADIVDSAAAVGLREGEDAYAERDGEELVRRGVELGLMLNHVNRAMGLEDLYPFVLSPLVRQKFVFAHAALSGRQAPQPA